MIIDRILGAISLFNVILTIIIPTSYKVEQIKINNRAQTIYTLSIETENPNIQFKNILSHDLLFGVEPTSEIVKQGEGIFGVNGMFYDEFGVPYGLLIIDGKVVSMDSIHTPTVTITKDGYVALEEIDITGHVIGNNEIIPLDGTNCVVLDEEWVLFDRVYGDTTRVKRQSMNYLIEGDEVIKIIATDQPVSLEQSDYVLTQVTDNEEPVFNVGDPIDIQFDISNHDGGEIAEAFQTGGWLVNNGQIVAKAYEPFIGYTTGLNPRTLIGMTEDRKLIFKVVDGRNPGISLGVSGYEAAQLMVDEGCVVAAYLDGGASSTMIINGEVVNQPSKGVEREVAHAIIIKIKDFAISKFIKTSAIFGY